MTYGRLLFYLSLTVTLMGCSSLGYYAQSIHGHLSLMGQSRPIPEMIADPSVDTDLKTKLRGIESIRTFSVAQLGLPDNGSYKSYADIGRGAVVWSVVATAEFSMEPKAWCYPIVGCASYRGFFSRLRADAFAADLQRQGFDVAVQPVPAYSTLGWFDDPVPSTVIQWQEANLAGLIFHELAHQKLYVKGDSAFNEAFATTVEQAGIKRWLLEHRGPDELELWQQGQQKEGAFVALLLSAKQRLVMLYREQVSERVMRKRKQRLFLEVEQSYHQLRASWDGYSGYDRWFQRSLNNAHLASVATYEEWVPAFTTLLDRSGGVSTQFYAVCEQLAELPKVERTKALLLLK